MTDEQIKQLLHAASSLIQPQLRDNPHWRTLARLTAQWLLEQAQQAEPSASEASPQAPTPEAAAHAPLLAPSISTSADLAQPPSLPTHQEPSLPAAIPALPAPPADAAHITPEDLNRIFTGPRVIAEAPASPPIAPRQTVESIGLDALLDLFIHRFDLQRQACLLRLELSDHPGDLSLLARRKEILVEAKEHCQPVLIWSMLPKFEAGPYCDLGAIARAYGACAATTRLLRRTLAAGAAGHRHLQEVVQACATAGSALRSFVAMVNASSREYNQLRDFDQDQLAKILIGLGAEHAFYIARHLRLDDPAGETDLATLEASLLSLVEQVTQDLSKLEESSKKLKQIRYHAEQIASGKSFNPDHDWNKIESLIQTCLNVGMPPSDRMLGAAVHGLLAVEVPELLKHTRHVLSFERQRTQKSAERQQQSTESAKVWSDDVLDVRRRLDGAQIVIIGGEEDENQRRRIESAFECPLQWVALSEHGTSDPMIAPIQSSSTGLVLIIIRLTGHLHAEKARQYAIAAGKPLVMLPQGWNPEVIAHEVLHQASGALLD